MKTAKYITFGAAQLNLAGWYLKTFFKDREGQQLIRKVRAQHLTFLPPEALKDLRDRVIELETEGIPGSLVEAGCALGGSAIVMARSKATHRNMCVYDVFGMIPPPGDRDGDDVKNRYAQITAGEAKGFGGETYYGYEPDLLGKVKSTFEDFGLETTSSNVRLVEGLFQDTIYPDGPVALAHVDGDWYDSVKVCLERLWPRMAKGGVIVIDDYEHWSGCREAVSEFLGTVDDCRSEWRTRLHLVKI